MPEQFDKVQQIVKSDAHRPRDYDYLFSALFWVGIVLVLVGTGILR